MADLARRGIKGAEPESPAPALKEQRGTDYPAARPVNWRGRGFMYPRPIAVSRSPAILNIGPARPPSYSQGQSGAVSSTRYKAAPGSSSKAADE
jgi:hypothetical protein